MQWQWVSGGKTEKPDDSCIKERNEIDITVEA